MKHYTSIEQSKKLLELGLPAESANMVYINGDYLALIDGTLEANDIPCWSVGALESLIWESSDGCVDLVRNEFGYFIRYGSSKWHNATGYHNTIIGACFEMVCCLLEKGYIKKGE